MLVTISLHTLNMTKANLTLHEEERRKCMHIAYLRREKGRASVTRKEKRREEESSPLFRIF